MSDPTKDPRELEEVFADIRKYFGDPAFKVAGFAIVVQTEQQNKLKLEWGNLKMPKHRR